MTNEINYIFWETAQWVVDWNNKVFTLLNPIDKIEEVYLGWVSYRNFSFLWDTLNLGDAPTTETWAPIVDYWKTTNTVVAWETTFWDIIDCTYSRLWQDRASSQYPIDLVKKYVNEGIRVLNNYKVNPLRKIGSVSFNKAPDFTVSSYSATQFLSSAISSLIPNTWKAILKYSEIVDYSGRTAWVSLNNLTNLNTTYSGWDTVSVWYQVTANAKKISEVLINNVPLTFVDRREFVMARSKFNYTIIENYLFLPYSLDTTDIVTYNYIKTNVECESESDIVDIESDYTHVLCLYALYNVMMDREDDRWQIQKSKFDEQFKWYRSYLSKTTNWINNKIPSRHLNQF